jgi:hypothetical protein
LLIVSRHSVQTLESQTRIKLYAAR